MIEIESIRTRGFALTDRKWHTGLSNISNEVGLSESDIDTLRPNAAILIAGSGLYRSFEKELLARRPDLLVASIDPTLGIMHPGLETPEFTHCIARLSEYVWLYKSTHDMSNMTSEQAQRDLEIHWERLRRATEIPGAVAALAPHLPFADSVFDMIFDVCGPAMYMPYAELLVYREEVKRVLAPHGRIYSNSPDKLAPTITQEKDYV